MPTKHQVLDVIRYGHAEIERFAERLSDEERNTIGDGDRWSARDMLAHVVETIHDAARRMAAGARGEALEDDGDFNARNAEMVADYRGRSWEDLRAALNAALPALQTLTDGLSEDELNDPQRFEQSNGLPAWRNIIGNALIHPMGFHIRPWYIAHGETDYATRQAETEAKLLLELNDSANWRANVLYNLACHCALIGEREAALAKLADAFRLAPRYAGFARDDPDFNSLRDLPEFEALLARQEAPQ